MESIFRSEGVTVPHTPASAVAAGQVVILGGVVHIAPRAIAAGELGSLVVDANAEFAKGTEVGDVGAVGDLWYWDASENQATVTTSGNTLIGYGTKAAIAADTFVSVKMVS